MNFISYLNYRKDVIFISIRQAKNNEYIKDHEAEFKVKIKNQTEFTDLNFKNLIQKHYEYQQDKVKVTTLSNYRNMMVYLDPLENI